MIIALWGSYGTGSYPKGFECKGKDFIEMRKALAEYIKENVKEVFNPEEYDEKHCEMEIHKAIRQSKCKCVCMKYKNHTKYYVEVERYLGYWELEELDTSKLWVFGEYDGAESIRYYKVTDNNRLIQVRKGEDD